MTLVAGIDSSTQSCKIVIVDAATGALVRTGRASHPTGTEVDPNAWWVALNEAITEAGGLDDVSAISVGGQQHGMVVLDAAGRVIRPALLWNDTRSAAAADALSAEFPDLAERTGSKPVASFTSTKLRWLRDAEPDNAALVAAVCLPHDWLTWHLRGFGPENPALSELTTDRSDASGTGYFNSVTNEYDLDVLSAALGRDASAITLPRVVAPGESAGTVAVSTLAASVTANAAISVACGAGDNAGAALGLGARTGDVVVSIGTSGTVFAVTEIQVPDATGTVAGFADASGIFLPLVATMNAARVLDSTATLLGVTHDELGILALEAAPGASGLVLQPYFEGERTPNLPDATATLFGMTLASTTRPSLARAAIEGLLCGLADGLDALGRQGVSAERILLIGGAAQNPAVSTIASQVFAVPVVVPEPAEYVALGAAAQAAWVLDGTRPDWAIATVVEPASDFHPIIREQYARYAV
ncbi:xylulokinase [Salinibacterium sp. SWN248]|uniref:xylulokinase n=1 Tax=Salinibacterium sp. SWN248 TaxID=2792056 RepID=UPI0018CE773A|nr:xylulokinase [Salinibacterium sp. SWN248]MBH0024498.1 xylulokinase [Salinibacterium sp. SWN248]